MPRLKKVLEQISSNSDVKPEIIVLQEPTKPKPAKKLKRNEKGEVVTKDGKPRDFSKATEALRLYRERKKKDKELAQNLPPVETVKDDDDDSDEADEYDVEQIEIKKKEPTIVEKEVIKEVVKEIPVEKEIIKEVIDPKIVEENKALQEKNKKLQESFSYNQHLNRISSLARQTSLKF